DATFCYQRYLSMGNTKECINFTRKASQARYICSFLFLKRVFFTHTGYSTNLVGKWHLGYFDWDYVPTERGFDTFLGIFLGEGDFWNHTKLGYLDMRSGKKPVWNYTGQHSTDVFTQEAIKIVTRHDKDKPLFLLVSYTAPHTPLQAHQRDIDKYQNVRDINRRKHLAMIDGVDQGIGKLVDACKHSGLWNDTLFIFLSDNGGHPGSAGGYNWPLRGLKSNLWEGGVRVPGFVHGNMLEKRGVVRNDLIHVTDWYPTLIKLAGVKFILTTLVTDRPVVINYLQVFAKLASRGSTADDDIDGVDQWGVLSQGRPSNRTEVLLNIDYAPDSQGEQFSPRGLSYYNGAAIRIGDMKLLHRFPNSSWYQLPEKGAEPPSLAQLRKDRLPFIELALYNITADPHERYDLSAKYPDVVQKMLARLKHHGSTAVKSRLQPEDPECLRVAAKLKRWEPWKDEDKISSAGSFDCWLTCSVFSGWLLWTVLKSIVDL
ncbi:hypothetical protein QZH41_014773, partial [Actinostola sp. cb2023]